MTLESLLVTDLVKYFDSQNYKNFRGIKAPTESTKQFSFDLMDKTEPFIVEENSGSVTYKNPEEKTVFVTNYEEFIKTLPKNLQNGKKRCDFLVYQEGKTEFFILNELSQSKNIDSKESDALYQLHNSLETLLEVYSIKQKLDSCKQKLCIFSNKFKKIVSPLGMADAFNASFMTMPQKAVTFDYDAINNLGFIYYRANVIELGDGVSLYNA